MTIIVASKHEIINRGLVWAIKLSENPEVVILMEKGNSLMNRLVWEAHDDDIYEVQDMEIAMTHTPEWIGLLVKKIT